MTLQFRSGVALGQFTTLEVGGPASELAVAATVQDLREALEHAGVAGLPLLVFGGGSNLVVADTGFAGLAVQVAIPGLEVEPGKGYVEVTAGAGVEWDHVVAEAVGRGWAGIECLSGIPGRVGAAPIQNIGAYGQEVAETIVRVCALEVATGKELDISNADCAFAYRQSRFKNADAGRYAIVAVTFRLNTDARPAIRYADLERRLGEQGIQRATLTDVREAVLAIRASKSMLLDGRDDNRRSVGSFFMNPIVTVSEFAEVCASAPASVPHWDAGDGRVKLSAAWLIEQSGFAKGYGGGAAGISSRHSLAIVNRGGARCADILALAREVRDGVRERFGVELHPEPAFVGCTL